jgi:CheY-like chemotaxis protein
MLTHRSGGMGKKAVHVVLIDDDEVDVEAVVRSFRLHGLSNQITVFRNGAEAIQALRGRFGRELTESPFLVLLDLNMPMMNGIEFLDAIRSDSILRRAIVFALTTSDTDEDKRAAYERHVAGYLVKSHMGVSYGALAQMLDNYWRIVEFPTSHGAAIG